ncbi:MAG: hypothetical protein ACYDCO_24800 [Armatimonadota bacterium]
MKTVDFVADYIALLLKTTFRQDYSTEGAALAMQIRYAILSGDVSGKHIEPFTDNLLKLIGRFYQIISRRQRRTGIQWLYEEHYADLQYHAITLLGLLQPLQDDRIPGAVSPYLKLRDRMLKYYAIRLLLERDCSSLHKAILEVAAWPETRNMLYDDMVSSGKAQMFPERYRTQEAFAESELALWLSWPTELGCAPDKMECEAIVGVDTHGEGILDFYFFRFRTSSPEWTNEWMRGMAGPYRRTEEPTTKSLGCTKNMQPEEELLQPEERVRTLAEGIWMPGWEVISVLNC